ncbi:type II toxin-antitoxin system HicB family antitoxin [Methanomicrobium antiquum]|uniref:Type II toxin-antitoxin system HicB family antitoxin n=1 Tax=Methanomicrobium antiquum TaxID=487686 RepID=A0AAF0FP11_9EURY|nr:type II toxin-antitoxin system HicB family antitoxin [Methanomicrobium antiquum]WFN36982.1 type II toxin-antitoxin system HicB family antitoxin [Methanomicrobium antiquum]
MKLEIVLEEEDDGTYSVHCPALKGCHSQGRTREEAINNIHEAVGLYLEVANEKARKLIDQPKTTVVDIAV